MVSSFNFDLVADEYDDYYMSAPGQQIDAEEKKLVSDIIGRIVKPGPMVEIGSGTGHWTSFFADKGFQVTGIEASEKMIDKAKQKNIPYAEFIHASATDLLFPNKSVPFVAMITALEFIKKPADVIDEINRILIPGGYVLIAGLNLFSRLGERRMDDPVLKYANFLTPERLKEILFGFGSVLEMQSCVFFNEDMTLMGDAQKAKLDNSERLYSGAFIAGLARKED